MPQIIREFQFDYGHRVLGHEGRCKYLHGHRAMVEVAFEAPALDALGRVIDFGVLKTTIGGWINSNLDHNMILNDQDPLAFAWNNNALLSSNPPVRAKEILGARFPYFLKDKNPTAEVLAEEIYNAAAIRIAPSIRIVQVRFWETPSCSALYVAPLTR